MTTQSRANVTAGMNKAQVMIEAGTPNVKASWFYLDQGWVRFKDGAVSAVERR